MQCFYDKRCLNVIQSQLNNSFTNQSIFLLPSQYLVNDTLETIILQLFIEEWNEHISFVDYFNQCNPTVCVYTYEKRLDVIYVITLLVSLCGGLTVALKLIVPFVVKLVRRKRGNNCLDDLSFRTSKSLSFCKLSRIC
jgi:hypothetical protein